MMDATVDTHTRLYFSGSVHIKNNITNVSMVHLSLSIQVNAFVYGFMHGGEMLTPERCRNWYKILSDTDMRMRLNPLPFCYSDMTDTEKEGAFRRGERYCRRALFHHYETHGTKANIFVRNGIIQA